MLDRNNINRVKGILSAKKGAEVPKYETGNKITLPAFNPGDPSFQQWRSKATSVSSNYQTAWRDYSILKSEFPTASIDELVSYMESGVGPGGVTLDSLYSKYTDANSRVTNSSTVVSGANPAGSSTVQPVTTTNPTNTSLNGTGAQTQVIGGTTTDPNASVVKAAEVVNQVANELDRKKVEEEAQVVQEATKSTEKVVDVNTAGLNTEKQKPDGSKEKNKEFLGKLGTGALNVGLEAFNGIGQAIGAQQATTDSNTTKIANTAYNSVAGIAENFGPVGKVVGAAMKNAAIAGDIIQSLGGGTDQQTTTDKWMDSSFFSWNIGMINGFFGKEADKFSADKDILASVGSSYGGTAVDINEAAAKSGKKYGLFSSGARRKANQEMAEARVKQNTMGDISDTAAMQRFSAQSMGEQAGLAYSMLTDGGYNQKYTYAAKQGGIIEWNPVIELEWQPQIELNWDLHILKEGGTIDLVEELEWIPEFQKGGKTEELETPEIEETTQKNVIPEGALHKNKHHMDHAEGLTKKGIPVIDEDGEQQAEIELNEIIFTLEVTKQLEEYYDIFYSEEATNKEKEQAALDAGKLLVYQILENTEDRTGLIESCKKGGTLQLKKSTDDLIEEVLDWMPTLVVVEEVVEEIKEKEEEKPKKKSEKEQMKEAIKEVLIELLTK